MIKIISNEKLGDYIDNKWADEECDSFLVLHSDNTYVACDNTDGNKWTEQFNDLELAIKWLLYEYEIGEEV